jgi:hypothetical protein
MTHKSELTNNLVNNQEAIASSKEHALAQSRHLNVLASGSPPPFPPPKERPHGPGIANDPQGNPSNFPQENPSVTEIASNPNLSEEASNPPQENTQFA